jgi:phospholipid transport system substrate-binding protein
MMRRFLVIGLLLVAAFIVSPRPSSAAQDPRDFVQGVCTQGLQAAASIVSAPQRIVAFRQLFQAAFDVPGIAQFALGLNWRYLNTQQQQEFVNLFGEYTAQAYATALSQYAGARVKVGGVSLSPAGEVIVSSKIKRTGATPVRVRWYLVDHGGQYKIVDVVVEGVSQRITGRNELAGVIQRNNGRADTIIPVLRQLLAQNAARAQFNDPSSGRR